MCGIAAEFKDAIALIGGEGCRGPLSSARCAQAAGALLTGGLWVVPKAM